MVQGVPFRPTDEHRRTVKAMAGLGVPHEGIAVLIEIDPKTLRKYFHAELERGSVGGDGQGGAVAIPAGHHRQERRGCDLLDEGARGMAGKARAASHDGSRPVEADGRAAQQADQRRL